MSGKVQLEGGPELEYEIEGGSETFVTLRSETINFKILAKEPEPKKTLLEELEDLGLKTQYVEVVAIFDNELELEVQSNSKIIAIGEETIYPR